MPTKKTAPKPETTAHVQPEATCPSCGYCPTCGRSAQPYRYYYPNWWYQPAPYVTWGTYTIDSTPVASGGYNGTSTTYSSPNVTLTSVS